MSDMNQTAQIASRRERLSFASTEDAIRDIERLSRGYSKCGSWSLPQTCWHLEAVLRFRMVPGPFPPNTAEQDARRPVLAQILANGTLPTKIEAPAQALPPAKADDSMIATAIAALRKWDSYSGDIAPHRLFGHLTRNEARRLNLVHAAHHLSYLVPIS